MLDILSLLRSSVAYVFFNFSPRLITYQFQGVKTLKFPPANTFLLQGTCMHSVCMYNIISVLILQTAQQGLTGKPGNVWYDKSYNAIWFANGMTASNCDVSTYSIIKCISVVSEFENTGQVSLTTQ